jgi:hypothetical protein
MCLQLVVRAWATALNHGDGGSDSWCNLDFAGAGAIAA